MGLALFLTVFIMWPTLTDVYNNSLKPFGEGNWASTRCTRTRRSRCACFMYGQMGNDGRTYACS